MTSLHADSPITHKEEDRLHYHPFARALAKGIVERAPSDGFVIGVQAQWGMGKSSAINLALEAIDELERGKEPRQKVKVQTFNPWLFSGLEALARGYLSQLGRVIDETLEQGTPQATRKFVERMIKGGAEVAGGLAALGAVAVTGGAAVGPIATAVKSTVTGALNLGAHYIDTRSLDGMVNDLKEHLAKIDTKLLVIVDDLDRLQPDEVRQVLTLVKTFGNLPNVIHLLVYDRDIVDRALGTSQAREDEARTLPTFLEKIVQVELDLPPPSSTGLRGMTVDRLTTILGPNPPMSQEHWWTVSHVAFKHYLTSPRDVIRLCNALSVAWPGVSGEVYVPDFVGIELIRHFEDRTYELLRDNKAFLTGVGGPIGDQPREELAGRIRDSIPEGRRGDVIDLLVQMFPQVNDLLKPRSWGGRGQAPSGSGRRIGAHRGFDAYFRFAPAPDEITVEELRTLEERLTDADFLKASIQGAMGRRRAADGLSYAAPLLEELRAIVRRKDSLDPGLFNVLLELGDDLIALHDEVEDFHTIVNRERLVWLLEDVVGRLPEDTRFGVASAAIAGPTAGLHTAATLVFELARPFNLPWAGQSDDDGQPLLTLDQVEQLGRSLVARIDAAAEDGTLATRPQIDLVLRVWAAFAGPATPRGWVASKLGEPGALLDIVFGEMANISSSAPPYRYRQLQRLPNAEVFDVEAMIAALEEHMAEGRIDNDARPDVERFINRARRFLGGQVPAQIETIVDDEDADDDATG
ncbi:hypothetical protein ILT44_06985 [Microvirga sp. BT689]|uniref:KAP family P-loop NTPase fold protein n=1 Tax=Microvirga arvi TaxID=2778731 RepID=UPI0019521B94|nr:P-loop NTPase fold protein [Microvirga arvi]MBM6579920.1 hypothetical protein [Microvirga arvi]